MTHTFTTSDHPEANGRKPVVGEQGWTFTFKLENGDKLQVRGGSEAHEAFRKMFEQEEIDDLCEGESQ